MNPIEDYYGILGIESKESPRSVRQAYKKIAKELKPQLKDNVAAQARFQRVLEAFSVLSDWKKRSEYDDWQAENQLLRSGSEGIPMEKRKGFHSNVVFGSSFSHPREQSGGSLIGTLWIILKASFNGIDLILKGLFLLEIGCAIAFILTEPARSRDLESLMMVLFMSAVFVNLFMWFFLNSSQIPQGAAPSRIRFQLAWSLLPKYLHVLMILEAIAFPFVVAFSGPYWRFVAMIYWPSAILFNLSSGIFTPGFWRNEEKQVIEKEKKPIEQAESKPVMTFTSAGMTVHTGSEGDVFFPNQESSEEE